MREAPQVTGGSPGDVDGAHGPPGVYFQRSARLCSRDRTSHPRGQVTELYHPNDVAPWVLDALRRDGFDLDVLSNRDFAYAATSFANAQGVLPLLYDGLVRQGRLGDLPAEVCRAWQGQTRRAAATDLSRRSAVDSALERLSREGIPFLVLKGEACARLLYSEPHLRIRSDVDLMFPDRDTADSAAHALRSLGYRRWPGIDGTMAISEYAVCLPPDQGGFCLDLHWRISNSVRLSRHLTYRDVRATAQALPGRVAAMCPSFPDLLLHACIHRLAHGRDGESNRLIWLYDIHLLAGRMSPDDWDTLLSTCRENAGAGICLRGLRAAEARFGPAGEPRHLRALEALSAEEPTPIPDGETPLEYEFAEFRDLRTWSERLRFLREHLFPDPEYMMLRDGLGSRAALPMAYVRRIIRGFRRRQR